MSAQEPNTVSFPFKQSLITAALACNISPVNAQDRTADACYAAQDQACLEELFSDIVDGPTPENTKALNLLGVLQRDLGDFESAIDTFMMGVAFGDSDTAQQALIDLFAAQPGAFNEPTDCLAIESDACFVAIIETGQGDAVRNAQYLFGSTLLETDAPRGAELLEQAHAAGHGSAMCVLQDLYAAGATDVAADYNKSVIFGLECGFNPPFAGFKPDHFAKYTAEPGHKAYALAENGLSSYSQGITDPDIAARLAVEYCNTSPHRAPGDPACRVINVDGVWVDSPETSDIPDFSGGFDGLITMAAQASYTDKYASEEGIKVFVQSKNGSWTWRSSGQSDATIEALTEEALVACSDGWRSRVDYPCEVINIDGEWVN